MGLRDTEAITYRSSTTPLRSMLPSKQVTQDEEDYSTLKAVHIVLRDAIAALYTDFNAFKIAEGVPKTTALYDLQRQIDGKQTAYDILTPALEAIESSLLSVDNKYKEN